MNVEATFVKSEITVGKVNLYLQASNPSNLRNMSSRQNQFEENFLSKDRKNLQEFGDSINKKEKSSKTEKLKTEEDKLGNLNKISQVEVDGMINALPAMDREKNFFYRIRATVHDCSFLPLLYDQNQQKFKKPSIYLEMGLRRLKSQMDRTSVSSSISPYKHKSRNPIFNWEKTFTIFENKIENLLSNQVFFLSIFEFTQKKKIAEIEVPLKHLLNFRPVHIESHLANWVQRQSESKLRPMETLDSQLGEEEMAKSNLQLLKAKVVKELEKNRTHQLESTKNLNCPRIRLSLVLESPLANLSDYLGDSVQFETQKKGFLKNLERSQMENSLIESIYAEPENHLELLEIVIKDVESKRKKDFWPKDMDILRVGLGLGTHVGPKVEWMKTHDLMQRAEIGRNLDMYNSLHKSKPVFLSKYFKKDCVKTDIFYKSLAVFVLPKNIFRLGSARVFVEVLRDKDRTEEKSFMNQGFKPNSGNFDVSLQNGKFIFQRKKHKKPVPSNYGENQSNHNYGENYNYNENGILIETIKNRKPKKEKLEEIDLTKDMEIVPKFILNYSLKDLKSNYNSPTGKMSTRKIDPFLRNPEKHKLASPDCHLNYFDLAQRIELSLYSGERQGLPFWMAGFTREIQDLSLIHI